MTFDDRIYYHDQTGWQPVDYQGLWRYLNRLFQFIERDDTPVLATATPTQTRKPDPLTTQIRAKRAGRRDAELAALDLSRMSKNTRYLMKHMLINAGIFDRALELFPNLDGLREVGELDHLLVLDEQPTYVHPYYTQVGIIL